jgi:hypothetical protein
MLLAVVDELGVQKQYWETAQTDSLITRLIGENN